MGEKQLLTVNGVDLCAESFGDSHDPVLLLIGGAGCAMDYWDVEFCGELATAGRRVIRYDLRDTGRSATYPPGAPTYTSRDLVGDVIGLLDVLGVAEGHLVGMSMGGGIAQLASLTQPARVRSLTLLSTTAIGPVDDELPGPSAALIRHLSNAPAEPDWRDADAVTNYLVADLRAYAGTLTVDDAAVRALVRRIVLRTKNIESSVKNHSVLPDDQAPADPQMSAITAPTLVMHGTADPLFPLEHGRALARAIPGARFVALEGVGHEIPPRPVWPVVIGELIRHTEPTEV
ncbi:alpha/beta fold hydrolase [Williamsia sp. 1135]|uniref:alpha/beta fold hydrolase n=1 Tax=Williamsia sp. 1135 TaxID=1889262 RepID=UPI000A1084A7|nr:alpha/beta fold hydrolase [Williamsia sp. 1135]ORM33403.1 hypothetical protein BFL43_13785 [Williamsia sp. 1135]